MASIQTPPPGWRYDEAGTLVQVEPNGLYPQFRNEAAQRGQAAADAYSAAVPSFQTATPAPDYANRSWSVSLPERQAREPGAMASAFQGAQSGTQMLPGETVEEYNVRQAAGEQIANAKIAGALQAGQLAAAAIPTAMDRRNAEQIRRLEAHQGMTPEEQQLFLAEGMAPVQQLAGEQLAAEEAQLAAMGDTSAGAQRRARQANRREVLNQARQVATDFTKAKMQAVANDLKELESRYAAKGQRQRQVLDMIGQTASGMAGVIGQARAGRRTQALDRNAFIDDQGVFDADRYERAARVSLGGDYRDYEEQRLNQEALVELLGLLPSKRRSTSYGDI